MGRLVRRRGMTKRAGSRSARRRPLAPPTLPVAQYGTPAHCLLKLPPEACPGHPHHQLLLHILSRRQALSLAQRRRRVHARRRVTLLLGRPSNLRRKLLQPGLGLGLGIGGGWEAMNAQRGCGLRLPGQAAGLQPVRRGSAAQSQEARGAIPRSRERCHEGFSTPRPASPQAHAARAPTCTSPLRAARRCACTSWRRSLAVRSPPRSSSSMDTGLRRGGRYTPPPPPPSSSPAAAAAPPAARGSERESWVL